MNNFNKKNSYSRDRNQKRSQNRNKGEFNMHRTEKPKNSEKHWKDKKENFRDIIKQDLKKLLDENNMTGLIKKAKEVAGKTFSKTNQIRRIYSSVVKIQEQLGIENQEQLSSEAKNRAWQRDLSMLKPRVVYASARDKSLKNLKNHIIAFIELIEAERKNQTQHKEKAKTTKDETDREKKMTEHFCHFMEAFVAYHKEKS